MDATDDIKLLNSTPSVRALAIAAGLVRTGRAATYQRAGSFICVEGVAGVRYWISDDGARVLRGDSLADADELQLGFANAMTRAGAKG